MVSFILYYIDGCYLCEMVDELLVVVNVFFVVKDIMDSE